MSVFMGSGLAICLVACASTGEKVEVELTLDQCPPPVQETISWLASKGEILEIERETEDGKTHYEAEIEMNGREYEIEVEPDGTLIAMELDED